MNFYTSLPKDLKAQQRLIFNRVNSERNKKEHFFKQEGGEDLKDNEEIILMQFIEMITLTHYDDETKAMMIHCYSQADK